MVDFPVSGVETFWWLPALVSFVISFLSSTGGLSGAFLLLPFQMSVLGFTSPSVSPTNLAFNVIAIPGGVYRFIREKRMLWPLAVTIIIGTSPGLIIGAYLRTTVFAEPRDFKLFVALVLLYIIYRLAKDLSQKAQKQIRKGGETRKFESRTISLSILSYEYEFDGQRYKVPLPGVLILTLFVGVIGGAYGIGGGAIIAPFLVAVYGLPVYIVAGPALLGTFFTSIAGIFVYTHLLPTLYPSQSAIYPDWQLGLSFGVGGFLGIYLGARVQRYLPSKLIKSILLVALFLVVFKYIYGYFAG